MAVKKYNPQIDVAKFLFSIVIILYHSNKLLSLDFHIFQYGYTAVEFFFMITGYLMVCSSKKFDSSLPGKSTFTFTINKIKSFYLYFIIAFVVAFFARNLAFYLDKTLNLEKLFDNTVLSVNELLLLHTSGIDFGKIYNGPTWYLSAMIIAIMILFPIVLKFKDWITGCGGFLIAVFIFAIISQTKGNLNTVAWWEFISLGVMRAIAGLSLGCFLFGLVERLNENNISLKAFPKFLLFLIELALTAFLFFLMQIRGKSRFDFIALILIFIITFIVLSGLTTPANIKGKRFFGALGKFSLVGYLNHRSVIYLLNAVAPELSSDKTFLAYILGILISCLFAEILYRIITFLWKKLSPFIKRITFATSQPS
ncbi:MAG: acyltransferase [Ruminococcaceae bacterium]|nr:acyltransferase [Oscillospiraceae bacterium]